jgi:hypothetical protein
MEAPENFKQNDTEWKSQFSVYYFWLLFGKYWVQISAPITAVLTEVYYDVSLFPSESRDGV